MELEIHEQEGIEDIADLPYLPGCVSEVGTMQNREHFPHTVMAAMRLYEGKS